MTAPHKSESPLAGGQVAEETTILHEKLSHCELIAKLRAQFAFNGHGLVVRRNIDRQVIYIVAKWEHCKVFTDQHDLTSCLAQIGGKP